MYYNYCNNYNIYFIALLDILSIIYHIVFYNIDSDKIN